EADLVLAVGLEMPGRHHELNPRAGGRRIEWLDDDRFGRRQAGIEQRLSPADGPGLRGSAVDPEAERLQLVGACRRQARWPRGAGDLYAGGQLGRIGLGGELEPQKAAILVTWLHAWQVAVGRLNLYEILVRNRRRQVEAALRAGTMADRLGTAVLLEDDRLNR